MIVIAKVLPSVNEAAAIASGTTVNEAAITTGETEINKVVSMETYNVVNKLLRIQKLLSNMLSILKLFQRKLNTLS